MLELADHLDRVSQSRCDLRVLDVALGLGVELLSEKIAITKIIEAVEFCHSINLVLLTAFRVRVKTVTHASSNSIPPAFYCPCGQDFVNLAAKALLHIYMHHTFEEPDFFLAL